MVGINPEYENTQEELDELYDRYNILAAGNILHPGVKVTSKLVRKAMEFIEGIPTREEIEESEGRNKIA